MEITAGRIVLYRLSEVDVTAIGKRGNGHKAGDILPMIAVRVWPDQSVNGQVFIDGQGTQFVNTRREGTEDGTWHWPVHKQDPKLYNHVEITSGAGNSPLYGDNSEKIATTFEVLADKLKETQHASKKEQNQESCQAIAQK